MEGALTRLRSHRLRLAALEAIAEKSERATVALAAVAHESGFRPLAEFPDPDVRGLVADAAIIAVRRERAANERLALQAGIWVLFVAGLLSIGVPLTSGVAVVALVLAAPTWALLTGAPDAILDLLVAMPIAGRPAADLLHARHLLSLAAFLGAGVDPALATGLARLHAGRPLPDRVLRDALAARFGERMPLGPDAESRLLGAAARLERGAQRKSRLICLGLAAVAMAAVVGRAVRDEPTLRGPFAPTPTATRPSVEDGERPGRFEPTSSPP